MGKNGMGKNYMRKQKTCNMFYNSFPKENSIRRSTVSALLKKFNRAVAINDSSKSGRAENFVILKGGSHLDGKQIWN